MEEIMRQQEAVRRSGAVNMFDRSGVQDVARQMGFDELVEWIDEHDAEDYVEMAEKAAGRFRDE